MTGLRLNAFISDWLMKGFPMLFFFFAARNGRILSAEPWLLQVQPGWKKFLIQRLREDFVDIWLSPVMFGDYKHFADRWGCASPLGFLINRVNIWSRSKNRSHWVFAPEILLTGKKNNLLQQTPKEQSHPQNLSCFASGCPKQKMNLGRDQ